VAANLVIINLTLAPLQHRAIALSASLSMIFNFLFLLALLRRKLAGLGIGYLLANLARIVAASLIMALGVHYAHPAFALWLGTRLPGQILNLALTISLGLALYGLAVFLFRVPELQEFLGHLKQKFRRH
jgi:putative peptidoglycan lipid II flippase